MKTDNENVIQDRALQGCNPSGMTGVWNGEAGLLLKELTESLSILPSIYGLVAIKPLTLLRDRPERLIGP